MWWIGNILSLCPEYLPCIGLSCAQVLDHAAVGNSGLVKLHQKWHQSLSAHTALLVQNSHPWGSCMWFRSGQMGVWALWKALWPWWQAWTLLGPGCYLHLAMTVQTVWVISPRLAKLFKVLVCLWYARSSWMYILSKRRITCLLHSSASCTSGWLTSLLLYKTWLENGECSLSVYVGKGVEWFQKI